jgi:hypothetical protein
MHFLPRSFCWAKSMPSRIRSRTFNSSQTRPLPRHGNACRTIPLRAHTMEWKSGSSSQAIIMGSFVQPGNTIMLEEREKATRGEVNGSLSKFLNKTWSKSQNRSDASLF